MLGERGVEAIPVVVHIACLVILWTPVSQWLNNICEFIKTPEVKAIFAVGMKRVLHCVLIFAQIGGPPVNTSIFVDDIKFAAHGQVVITTLAIGWSD